MINSVSLLLNAAEQEFQTTWEAPSLTEKNKELACRLARSNEYMPKIVFKDERILSVECSPAKCLYGNNVYEVSSSDFSQFIRILQQKLCRVGIVTAEDVLTRAHCWRVDYAKEIFFPLPARYITECLLHCCVNGRMKRSITVFPGEGKAINGALKRRKIVFYDKGQEVLKDATLPSAIANILKNLKGSLWRYEVSMKTAKEIRRELKKHGYNSNDVSLGYLFDDGKAQCILKGRFQEIKGGLNFYQPSALLDSIWTTLSHAGCKTPKKLIYQMAVMLLTCVLGFSAVRDIVAGQAGKRAAKQFEKDFRSMPVPADISSQQFITLTEKSLNDMKPLSQDMLNSFPQRSLAGVLCLNAPVLLAILYRYGNELQNKLGDLIL